MEGIIGALLIYDLLFLNLRLQCVMKNIWYAIKYVVKYCLIFGIKATFTASNCSARDGARRMEKTFV